MKIRSLTFVLALAVACGTAEEKFDEENPQLPVLTRNGVDSVLSIFEQVPYTELDTAYIRYTESDGKFESSLADKTFYILEGDDVLRYVVGTYRIKNFLAQDDYYVKNEQDYGANRQQYWLVDKKMLYMLLDLILTLDEQGYDQYGFAVRESHRPPRYNAARGGASKSQHIWGTAVDIVIKDINKDGKADQTDKKIVLEIMEKIVGNKGGLGKYPGTMTVHFDCRGHRARWDDY